MPDVAAGIDDAADHVGLIEEIFVFLVEAAEFDQRLAAKRTVRAQQMRKFRRERIMEPRRRAGVRVVRISQPIDGDEPRLKGNAGPIVDDAAGAGPAPCPGAALLSRGSC